MRIDGNRIYCSESGVVRRVVKVVWKGSQNFLTPALICKHTTDGN
jgi:hypothetical protein